MRPRECPDDEVALNSLHDLSGWKGIQGHGC